MSEVTIYGASDDLVEVEGSVPGCDEYPCERASFVVVGRAGQKGRIRVSYGKGGLWGIEVAPLDEDIPMLPVTVEQADRGYSAIATIQDVDCVIHEAAL